VTRISNHPVERLAQRRGFRGLAVAIVTAVTILGSASLPTAKAAEEVPSVREQAAASGILIGSGAIRPGDLDIPQFATTLATHFKSLSPDNELKWSWVEPEQGVFNLAPIDKLVAFAEQHDMVVKGHGFVSSAFNPDWLTRITDPNEARRVAFRHFQTIMARYRGTMDRYDVVTEPLSTFGGTGLTQNYWYNTLGPDYIAELFQIAHRADPQAKLFLNESLVESYPVKRQELYDLVAQMVHDGVPINGVGIESHQTTTGPPPGQITGIVNEYKALGLEVAITEMDVHNNDNVTQAEVYRDYLAEALAAGVSDVSFWGFTDYYTWTWQPLAKPHIFDKQYNPKPAFYAVLDAVANHPCWLATQPDCWAAMSAENTVLSVGDPVEPVDPEDVRPPDNS
jgi:endo-1,4-beta-xylanase